MKIKARFASKCPCCGHSIVVGSDVEWARGQAARHVLCADAVASESTARTAVAPRRSRRGVGPGAGTAAPIRGYSSYCTDRPGCRCYDCAS